MADDSKRWHFRRGLDPGFMKELAKQGGWFADVLADPDLILGIRNNYVNVYWHGQSLFKIERNGKASPLKFSTHPKYLVDPDLSKEVTFDGSAFDVGRHQALATKYDHTTLGRMKRAAKLYSGGEKDGVHAVVRSHPNVIDTELAFNCEAEKDVELHTQRMDLACFEEVTGNIRLRFWEAKLYNNPELRADSADAPVVGQIKGYCELIEKHRHEIVESYHRVAENLVEMAGWFGTQRKVGELVQRVAAGEPVTIDEPPRVGLLIYGYDADDKGSKSWNTHIGKLKKVNGILILSAGKAKNIRLRPHV
jgi:hypothetical protein